MNRMNAKKLAILLMAIVVASSFTGCISESEKASIGDFFAISTEFSDLPEGIVVSDSSPFYPLIATPLAVHYNDDREVIPLLVKNFTNPSRAVERCINQMGIEPITIEDKSVKDVSLEIASYWKKSEGVMIIENSQEGYELAVSAVPLASYFCIPVIVTDEIDEEVEELLKKLGVRYSIICGDVGGYKKRLRFESIEEIVNASIKTVEKKFGGVEYVTMANPIDAWPPEVLDGTSVTIEPVELKTIASTLTFPLGQLRYYGSVIGKFTIPEDYKYALVKFEGINLDDEDVDELGDSVSFYVGPNLPDLPGDLGMAEIAFSRGTGRSPSVNGKDVYYTEAVLYDRGGVEYNVQSAGTWLAKKTGKVKANIIIEKLDGPIYPMMKGLSSIAPYLTAYHKGIVFARPDFAFAANDNVLVDGKTCPGYYMPVKNPRLVEPSNRHVFDNIHLPLNKLLAKLADIPSDDLQELREHYVDDPIYIALVGGATVLPQYIYDSYLMPKSVEECDYTGGGPGTSSDVIYGNIDPIPYDWSNTANDTYSYYPCQENIVGRITGWDAQDASALVARTTFYDRIIDRLGDWKDNAALLMGGGQDFQKPFLRYLIFGDILGLTPRGEPMKFWTGYGEISGERTVEQVYEPLGFNVYEAYGEEAMREGFDDKAIDDLKKASLLNRLKFRKLLLKRIAGEDVVNGGELLEKSNFIWANAHGWTDIFAMDSIDIISAGSTLLAHEFWKSFTPLIMGGFIGPGMSLSEHGAYVPREVETMNLGPSFMWLESCVCGKIDGSYPPTNIGQSLLHAGVNALIAASTESNIAGGYLEPKDRVYDFPWIVSRAYRNTTKNAEEGNYPDPHFGYKIYTDICEDLRENDVSIGLALRNARNKYLSADANWTLWWSPPLVRTGNAFYDYELAQKWAEMAKEMNKNGKDRLLKNKYISFQEYLLFADPAFNPWEPCNRG